MYAVFGGEGSEERKEERKGGREREREGEKRRERESEEEKGRERKGGGEEVVLRVGVECVCDVMGVDCTSRDAG